jgi:hypothetical protein
MYKSKFGLTFQNLRSNPIRHYPYISIGDPHPAPFSDMSFEHKYFSGVGFLFHCYIQLGLSSDKSDRSQPKPNHYFRFQGLLRRDKDIIISPKRGPQIEKSATAERRPLECLVGQASNLVTVHCQGLPLGVCSSFNYSPHIWRGPR